jgi:hypothetical protein
MAVKYAGITPAQAFYDYDAWFETNERMNLDLKPDIYWPAIAAYPGRSFDALQLRQLKWPGGGGAPDHSGIQYTDKEYMKPEEYDRFLDDPTDSRCSGGRTRPDQAIMLLFQENPPTSIRFEPLKPHFQALNGLCKEREITSCGSDE